MQQKGMETKVIYHNILEAMGNTPLIRLNRMADEESAQILVKFEGLNVGGSIKTRTAYNMIREAENRDLSKKIPLSWSPPAGIRESGLLLSGQCADTRRRSSCLIRSARREENW